MKEKFLKDYEYAESMLLKTERNFDNSDSKRECRREMRWKAYNNTCYRMREYAKCDKELYRKVMEIYEKYRTMQVTGEGERCGTDIYACVNGEFMWLDIEEYRAM